ncbi:Hexapeptide repeat of succinyl-transferase [Clostridium cadaveris]|uniref:Hexapeptide repeat of succinyl-transferase n=1 Tax=Clostridium cadaveris TaxID=1529 RepID=A0A1I2N7E7_9CLOT|nr:acyltransferase [Clostridium cadaveris]MDM8313011.1 acyltransferase [Clostridium cadaveris]SFF99030.1 Hexapeptide repeat of succinyl-transferase [Clostridium cadaveris]
MRKIISVVSFLRLKIRLGKKLKMYPQNDLSGKVDIKIEKDAEIMIGRGLHSIGPLYLKAIHSGCIILGKNCFFNHNCSITAERKIQIGDSCCFGNNLVIVDHDHDIRNITNGEFISDDIVIGNKVWVGANVTILRGTYIGDNCVIAANSVVKGNIEDGTIYREKKYIKTKTIK